MKISLKEEKLSGLVLKRIKWFMSNIKTAFYFNLTIPCFRVLNTFENFFSIYLKSVNAYFFSYLYLYNIKAETLTKLFHWFNATSNALRSSKSNWRISMICQCNDIFMLWPINISDGARRTLIVLIKRTNWIWLFPFCYNIF